MESEHRREWRAAWHAKNKERINAERREKYTNDPDLRERMCAASRSYGEENRETIRAKKREAHVENREANAARHKAWRLQNKERLNAYTRKWRAENPEAAAVHSKEWRTANSGAVNAVTAKRRAGLLNATPSWLTPEHWQQIAYTYEEAARISEATSIKHVVDHIVPLQGKTVCGLHVPWNLQILTEYDNLRKGNRLLPEDRTHHVGNRHPRNPRRLRPSS